MAKNKAKMNKFLTGAITATMVATAVAPTAALAADKIDFSDVDKEGSHYPNIINAAERGLMTGYADGTFKPTLTMNRGQVVKALGKYLVGQEGVTLDQYIEKYDLVNKVEAFEDVPATHVDKELFKYSLIVKDAKAFTGNNNNLHPTNDITRQQMAKVLVNAFNLKAVEDSDVEVADMDTVFGEYKGYVEILAENEITKADDGKFRPAESVTRQQMASFLNRSYTVIHGEDDNEEEVDPAELNVKAVTAITATTVTVEIDAPTEDLVDQTVVVKDGAGKTYAVNAATIKAGATTATFNFVTPLTVSPTSQWTVNGVAYKVAEFGIVAVESLDVNNKNLVVQFNSPITSLDASEITIRETVSQIRKGVSEVTVAKDGMSAQIKLVGGDNVRGLDANTEYTLSLTQSGKVTSFNFQIPGVLENYVVADFDAENRSITVEKQNVSIVGGGIGTATKTLNVPKDMAFDFKELEGRELVLWFDKDDNVSKYNVIDQTVVYGAVEFVTENGKDYVKLVGQDKKYQLETAANVKSQLAIDGASAVDFANGTHVGQDYAYGKVVLRSNGKVDFVVAETFGNSILVEKVSETYVQSYGNEVNLKDYTITKDGKTISISDLQAGDVVYYSNVSGNKAADVYSEKVTGKISNFYKDEFKLDGKVYSYKNNTAQVLVDGEFEVITDDNIAPFTKSVDVYVDRAGELVYVTGELGEIVTSKSVNYATKDAVAYDFKGSPYVRLATQNDKGEKVTEEIDVTKLEKLTIGDTVYQTAKVKAGDSALRVDGFKYDGTITNNIGDLYAASINNDGKYIDGSGTVLADQTTGHVNRLVGKDTTLFNKGNIINVVKNADGEVIELAVAEASTNQGVLQTDIEMSTNPKTLNANADGTAKNYQLTSGTAIFIQNADNTITSTTWGKLDSTITKIKAGGGTDDVTVNVNTSTGVVSSVIIPSKAIEGQQEAVTQEAVVSNVRYNTKGEVSEVSLMKNGTIKTYDLAFISSADKTIDLKVGDVVSAEINNTTGKVQDLKIDAAQVAGTNNVIDVNGDEFNTAKKEFKVVGGASVYKPADTGLEVYQVTGTGANQTVEAIQFSDLPNIDWTKKQAVVSLVASGTTYADVIVIKDQTVVAPPLADADTELTVTSTAVDGADKYKLDITFADVDAIDSVGTVAVGGTGGSTATASKAGLVVTVADADTNLDLSTTTTPIYTFDVTVSKAGFTASTVTIEVKHNGTDWVATKQ